MEMPLSLDQQYSETCKELKQPENPFIFCILQEVELDDDILTKKITIKIAGNNRLIPVVKVTDADFQVLSAIFMNNAFLTGLDLRYNLLTDVAAAHIGAFLQENRTLCYLNLMFNDIGTAGAEFIAKALHRNETLMHLRMTGNKIDNKGGMYFAAMLQINTTLQKLDLGDCDLGTQSLIALATVLNHNESIRAINLNRPILYSEEEASTVHLALMLRVNITLVELHLCKHEMKNFGIERLCDALYENHSLRYLDLSCNKITRDGVRFLGKLLKLNNTLEILDLNFNRIEDDGALYLSEALASHNRTLQAERLDGVRSGAKLLLWVPMDVAMVQWLSQPHPGYREMHNVVATVKRIGPLMVFTQDGYHVQRLAVTNNNISGQGLVALSEAMRTNETLTYIYIWGNKIDESACVAFADLLQSGRLKPTNTDVEPYVVDGHTYLAEVSHGLKKHYYWTPSYGEPDNKDANASLAIAPVAEHL